MELYETIRKRRSVRKYQKKELPQELLCRLLEAGRMAPSAKNNQPWKFVVIKDETCKKQLAICCKERMWIADASVIIAAVATNPDYRMGNGRPSDDIDLSIALTHIMLAAAGESLGSCWIGSFDYDRVKALLGIPEKFIIVSLLTIGYPAEVPMVKERKSLDEIVCYDRWSE